MGLGHRPSWRRWSVNLLALGGVRLFDHLGVVGAQAAMIRAVAYF